MLEDFDPMKSIVMNLIGEARLANWNNQGSPSSEPAPLDVPNGFKVDDSERRRPEGKQGGRCPRE